MWNKVFATDTIQAGLNSLSSHDWLIQSTNLINDIGTAGFPERVIDKLDNLARGGHLPDIAVFET